MAVTFTSTSYVGELAKEPVADILLSGDTISKGAIMVHPEVKKKEFIQTLTTNATFQARADAFTASGATTVAERSLTPTNLMTQEEVGVTVLLTAWQAAQMKPGANNNALTDDISSFLIGRKAQIITNQIDELIWQGSTALTSNTIRKWHDGILTLAKADSSVTKYKPGYLATSAVTVGATTSLTVSSTTNLNVGDKVTCLGYAGADAADLNGLTFTILSITSATVFVINAVTTGHTITTAAGGIYFINKSNVIAALEGMLRATPAQVRQAPDFAIYVPDHVAEAYIDANMAAGIGHGVAYQNEYGLLYKGKQIFRQLFFDENTILTTRVENLWFGTDLVSDQNEVSALYMKPNTGDDTYRFSAKFSSSVNYGFATQMYLMYPY